MGAPFWSWNSKNKRCHLKVTNTDQKLSVGCGRETRMPLVLIQQAAQVSQKNIRLTVHATDKKKGYLKDLIYRFKINVYLTFKKSFC